jgi:enoyl-[acyl-carrier protein] reductase I
MNFLELQDKWFLISGMANKKSVAYHCAKILEEQGAKLIFTVQAEKQQAQVKKTFPNSPIILLDVESREQMEQLPSQVMLHTDVLHGLVHSMAFANFSEGPKPFHETNAKDFLQACHISCFSLTEISNQLKDIFDPEASVVTISISNTKATSYGYLGPIKAALETSVYYLAKSFSEFSKVRFNSVGAGPLKTSASAGIPNYIENYVFAEQLTLRKNALQTPEVANTVAFLLSPRSSGFNGSHLIIDAGMSVNYFDQKVVQSVASDILDS